MGMTWSARPGRWLKITAVIEIVLAIGFAVVGFMSPLLRSGFYLTAGILGGVGVLLLIWGARWSGKYQEAQRLKATGVPGQARIMNMRQTGVYVNEQPQVELTLEVSSEMQGPYQVTLKEYVPLMLLGALTSGRPLPVKVDPQNPQNVVIEWENAMSGGMQMGGGMPMGGGMAVGAGGQVMQGTGPPAGERSEDTKKRVLETGISGQARVVSANKTGQNDPEGRPIFDLQLEVQLPGYPPINAPAKVGIPHERVDQLEPGDTVPIKADPANISVMAVDWDNA
jgi:hypothetical protein